MMKKERNIEILQAQACQRATYLPDCIIPVRLVSTGWQAGLTTPNSTPAGKNTTPTGLTTLSGYTTLSGCGKNEIQFSIDKDLPYYSLLTGGKARRMEGREVTVIHRAQAVRACLLPFFTQFFNNN